MRPRHWLLNLTLFLLPALALACSLTLPQTVLRGSLVLENTDGGAPREYRYTAVIETVEARDGGVPDFPSFPDAEPADAEPADAEPADAEPADAGTPDAGPPPSSGRLPPGLRHVYSQLQPWSASMEYYLAIDVTAGDRAVVLRASDFSEVARLGGYGHRWRAGTDQLLWLDDDDAPAKVRLRNIGTGEEKTLALPYPGIRAARSWERTSADGRWLAVYVDEPEPRILTYDLERERVEADVAVSDLGIGYEPDWVGVDPNGQYLAVQWVTDGSGRARGLQLYDIEDAAPVRQVTTHHNHGDFGRRADGSAYFASIELRHPDDNNYPGLFLYDLGTGAKSALGGPLPWGRGEHFSGTGPDGSPITVTASTQFPDNGDDLFGTVWLQHLDGSREIVGSHGSSGSPYYAQPHAVMSPDGRSVAYATDEDGYISDRVLALASQPAPDAEARAGMGLGFAAYWAREATFLNGFRMAEAGQRTIGPDGQWSAGNVRLGPDGWVEHLDEGHRAIWIVPTGLGGPSVMTWSGEDCFDFGGVDSAPSNIVRGTEQVTMDLQPNSFILVAQNCVGPTDLTLVPVRYADAFARGRVWYPELEEALAPFGAVRTMDWADTNHYPPGSWDQRFTPSGSQEGGVAWEWHARLANDLDKDLWVTVPHTADRAYLTALARLMDEALEPERRLYVEHSNEVWNGQFPQAQFAQNDPSAGDGDYTEGMRWHGRRTALIHEVFAAEMPRAIVVLGCWAANSWTCARSFESMDAEARAAVRVAIAPYFGHDAAGMLDEPARLWAHLRGPALDEVERWLDAYAEDDVLGPRLVAGPGLLAYEGGQHIVSEDVAANRAAQTAPEMGDVYEEYLRIWSTHPAAGGTFMFFTLAGNWSRHGFWGHLEVIGGGTTPKYDAAASWANQQDP